MIWLIVGVVLVVVVALIVGCFDSSSGAMTDRATVDLHAIRRRQEVSRFKVEVKRDAAAMRRQLREELREPDHQERRP